MRTKVIALIDPYHGGHHRAFMRLFVKALRELDHEVWVFFPDANNSIASWFDQDWLSAKPAPAFFDFADSSYRASNLGPFNDAATSLAKWIAARRALKNAERELGKSIDIVFFAWLDSYLANYLSPILVDVVFNYKWSGLYFHPRHMRMGNAGNRISLSSVDSVLRARNCSNICVHDDAIREMYTNRLRGKKVIYSPEIADDSPPEPNHPLSRKIKELARERTVVGMIGLSPHQGLQLFCEVATKAPQEEFFFALIGELNENLLSSSEIESWSMLRSVSRDNYFLHLESLTEGVDYNSVFSCIDIIWLVYKNFSSTSNRLTKAAHFKKLVICSDAPVLAELVDRYRLGLIVKSFECDQAMEVLYRLKKSELIGETKPDFEGYLGENSYAKLVSQFGEVLS